MPTSDDRRLQALVLAPVRRVQRRLQAVRIAEGAVVPVWAAATACVLLRWLLRDAAFWLMPLPVLVAGGWAWRRARRVSLRYAAVLADRAVGAGGLLLTRLERPVGEWELTVNQHARAVTPPSVAWRRPAGALLAALLFLLGGLWMPLPSRPVRPANAAAAARVEAVRARAEALARETPPDASVEEELRRLVEEVAEGRFDAADWEATDRLAQSLEARAARAAAELAAASEAARELEAALDAALGAEAATREREALESALLKLGLDEGTPGGASTETGGSPDTQTPRSREEIADLRETLERRQRQLEQPFGGGSKPGGSRPGGGQGKGEGKEGEGQGNAQGHASRQTGKQGAGAGRGGESQPLVFGEKAEMDPERLAFKPLPRGQGGEAGGLWGLRPAEPERRGEGPVAAGQGTGARGEAEAGHGDGPLLPRNRDLVRRYFGEQP